jgi:hypothetical protein
MHTAGEKYFLTRKITNKKNSKTLKLVKLRYPDDPSPLKVRLLDICNDPSPGWSVLRKIRPLGDPPQGRSFPWTIRPKEDLSPRRSATRTNVPNFLQLNVPKNKERTCHVLSQQNWGRFVLGTDLPGGVLSLQKWRGRIARVPLKLYCTPSYKFFPNVKNINF